MISSQLHPILSLYQSIHQLEGTHLLGRGDVRFLHNFHKEQDLAATACLDNGKIEISIVLRTDNYGYETSWVMYNSNGKAIACGPPSGTNYDDSKSYAGRWCMSSPEGTGSWSRTA